MISAATTFKLIAVRHEWLMIERLLCARSRASILLIVDARELALQ
jgi:hypothetical protein